MSDAANISILLPLPRDCSSVNDDGTDRETSAHLFHQPQALDLGQLDIDHAQIDRALLQKGLRLIAVAPMHDTILLNTQR